MKNIKNIKLLVCVLGLLLFNAIALFAAETIPLKINYQARLKESGALFNGTKSVTFGIYSGLTGGSAIWSETHASVQFSSGISVGLVIGDVNPIGNPIPVDIFSSSSTRYLEVQIGSDILSPREPIYSAPYSFNANKLDGVDTAFVQTSSAIYVSNASGYLPANVVDSSAIITGAIKSVHLSTGAVQNFAIADLSVSTSQVIPNIITGIVGRDSSTVTHNFGFDGSTVVIKAGDNLNLVDDGGELRLNVYGLGLDNLYAGNGLYKIGTSTFVVGSGNGITVDVDSISVNTTSTFNPIWQGTHTFNSSTTFNNSAKFELLGADTGTVVTIDKLSANGNMLVINRAPGSSAFGVRKNTVGEAEVFGTAIDGGSPNENNVFRILGVAVNGVGNGNGKIYLNSTGTFYAEVKDVAYELNDASIDRTFYITNPNLNHKANLNVEGSITAGDNIIQVSSMTTNVFNGTLISSGALNVIKTPVGNTGVGDGPLYVNPLTDGGVVSNTLASFAVNGSTKMVVDCEGNLKIAGTFTGGVNLTGALTGISSIKFSVPDIVIKDNGDLPLKVSKQADGYYAVYAP
jgi:hypothetical protein